MKLFQPSARTLGVEKEKKGRHISLGFFMRQKMLEGHRFLTGMQ